MTTLVKWSVDDYHQMISAGILKHHRVELLAGDIVEVSPEEPIHASRIRIGFRQPTESDYANTREFREGKVNPLAFPEIEVSVEKFLR
jgi:Uma2 family endonuclease